MSGIDREMLMQCGFRVGAMAFLACELASDPRPLEIGLVVPLDPDPFECTVSSGCPDDLISFIADHPTYARTEVPFSLGDDVIELPAITPDEGWTFELVRRSAGSVVAQGRTCSADIPRFGDLPAPALLFASLRRFSTVGSLPAPWQDLDLFPLGDGGVLVCGGVDSAPTIYRREIAGFELVEGPVGPVTGAVLGDGSLFLLDESGRGWQSDDDTPEVFSTVGTIDARAGSAVAPYQDGVIIVGGSRESLTLSETVYFDGAKFSSGPSLMVARRGAIVVESAGFLAVVGGTDSLGNPVAMLERLSVGGSEFVTEDSWVLSQARHQHTATVTTKGIVVIGGLGGKDEPLASLELIDVLKLQVQAVDDQEYLPFARYAHVATALFEGSRVLVTGGLDNDGAASRRAWLYDEDIRRLDADSMHVGRANHAAAVLCDGQVLIVGGDDPVAEIYNPAEPTGKSP